MHPVPRYLDVNTYIHELVLWSKVSSLMSLVQTAVRQQKIVKATINPVHSLTYKLYIYLYTCINQLALRLLYTYIASMYS